MVAAKQPKPLDMTQYIPVGDAVKRFPVKMRTLRRWIATGFVQSVFVKRNTGGRRFIKLSSLQKRFVPES